MKHMIALVLLLSAAQGYARDPITYNSLKITILGTGPAVDVEAYQQVRKTIGNLIAEGTVDRFVVHGYGDEGGFTACIKLNYHADVTILGDIKPLFEQIHPDQVTTFYKLEAAQDCQP